ncbi:hypothetical protein [Novosphingobium sp. ST904]|uniref:hypothetical protein n=1 Tax=Novosphingobium sp. ST904 TaxID=1684385 RepID=UPI0006C8547F|nr:hypothetical protein [Novosphingobium sp. ST904]KPH59161.1 hypothetical protein ADT71_23745 [Novosphingobium sp. ST904]TCM37756.1 hypothetical protein EDF59_110152 [Novosphingobium sp. ST904]
MPSGKHRYRPRWSDNDKYFGPFTYSRDGKHYRPFEIMLTSGKEEHPDSTIRFRALGHTIIVALPGIIKSYREWIDTSHYEWSKSPNGGYWEEHRNQYGFSVVECALHLHYGAQTHSSDTTKSKVWFLPWKSWRHVRHSVFDLAGDHFATIPERGRKARIGEGAWRNHWTVQQILRDACPTTSFEFRDYDGELITATTRIEERHWKRGEGKFKWLSLFWPDKIKRSLDLHFSSEVGRRKGSWKGGTIGHSIDMNPGELHEAAFRRYCEQNQLDFVGAPSALTANDA